MEARPLLGVEADPNPNQRQADPNPSQGRRRSLTLTLTTGWWRTALMEVEAGHAGELVHDVAEGAHLEHGLELLPHVPQRPLPRRQALHHLGGLARVEVRVRVRVAVGVGVRVGVRVGRSYSMYSTDPACQLHASYVPVTW
eukprot:scaffold48678_cov36-Phaeocystis_antarctica.AAC.2